MASQVDPAPLDEERLKALGLSRQPFGNDGFFFEDADLESRRNLALHMLQSGEGVTLVLGPAGVGRTSFLKRLMEEPDGPHCIGIWGSWQTSAASLKRTLAELRSAEGESQALLVDDADSLNVDVLRRLIIYCTRGEDRRTTPPRLLLSAHEENEDEIRRLLAENGVGEDRIHLVRLAPLSENQSRAYLTARLASAGDAANQVLSVGQKRRIHRQAKGIPARLNQAAIRALSGKRPSAATGFGAFAGNWPLTAALGVVVVLLVSGLIVANWFAAGGTAEKPLAVPPSSNAPRMANEGPDQTASAARAPGTKPKAASSPSAPTMETPSEPSPSGGQQYVAGAQNQGTPAQSAAPAGGASQAAATEPEKPRSGESKSTPEAATDVTGSQEGTAKANSTPPQQKQAQEQPAPAEKQSEAAQQAAPEANATAEAPSKQQSSKPEAVAKAEGSSEKPAAKEPATAENTAPKAAKSKDWLSSRDPKHYTIQLLGAYEPATVERFISQNSLKGQVHVLQTTRKGKPWHVVVMGDYESRNAAGRALQGLSKALRVAGPWPRTFASLR